MFKKPFKTKTQNLLKGSERKKLRSTILKQLPSLVADVLSELVPQKDDMCVAKVTLHTEQMALIYFLQKNPIFFDVDGILYPSVYTLWKFPSLVPIFKTWPEVFHKLLGGADLMLPGIITRGPVTPNTFKSFHKGDMCAVQLKGNLSPVAVGQVAMSGSDMYESNMKGKGVIIIHHYQDYLWAAGDKSNPPLIREPEKTNETDVQTDPQACEDVPIKSSELSHTEDSKQDLLLLSTAEYDESLVGGASTENESLVGGSSTQNDSLVGGASTQNDSLVGGAFTQNDSIVGGAFTQESFIGEEFQVGSRTSDKETNEVGSTSDADVKENSTELGKIESVFQENELANTASGVVQSEDDVGEVDKAQNCSTQELMDELLYECFLCALKNSIKKPNLPILTSAFYKQHMLPFCPESQALDVKKSKYKKLSKFLQDMQEKDLVTVKEFPKGVDNITEVNFTDPRIKEFDASCFTKRPPVTASSSTDEGSKVSYKLPTVTEMYIVTAPTLLLFNMFGYKKGDALSAVQVKSKITDYVRLNQLQLTNQKQCVQLDDTLVTVLQCGKHDSTQQMKWEDIFNRVTSKMSPAHQITREGEAPILKKGQLQPVQMSVVERMGRKKVTLVHNLELYSIDPYDVAATVRRLCACSTAVNNVPGVGAEVFIQGNQVAYVGKLLLEQYKLPRKSVQGLELAPKKPKGK